MVNGAVDALGVVVVTVSVPDAATGDRIAEAVVGERLAACVKRSGPVRSVYRWQGSIEREDEWALSCMTTLERFEALATRVRELHPYEVPEVVGVPVVVGTADYLRWVAEESAATD